MNKQIIYKTEYIIWARRFYIHTFNTAFTYIKVITTKNEIKCVEEMFEDTKSEGFNRRTDNTVAKRKRTKEKGQTTIYKELDMKFDQRRDYIWNIIWKKVSSLSVIYYKQCNNETHLLLLIHKEDIFCFLIQYYSCEFLHISKCVSLFYGFISIHGISIYFLFLF